MKKTIFDLKNTEGIKLDFEMRKTSYYRQYLISYIFSFLILAIGFVIGIIYLPENDLVSIIILCFMALITLLFMFKKFDLLKEYYNSKNEKQFLIYNLDNELTYSMNIKLDENTLDDITDCIDNDLISLENNKQSK